MSISSNTSAVTPQDPQNNAARLDSLTALRLFPCLAVFLYHALTTYYVGARPAPHDPPSGFHELLAGSRCAVSFFFLLSGCLLGWSWSGRTTLPNYYRRRFWRIYPTYLIAGIAIAVLLEPAYTAEVAIKPIQAIFGLLLIQSWVPSQNFYSVFNGPLWSLSCEVFCYVIFPFVGPPILRLAKKHRRMLQVVLLVAIFGHATINYMLEPLGKTGSWVGYYLPATRATEFLFGITLVGEIKEKTFAKVRFSSAAALAVVAFICCGIEAVRYNYGLVAITLIPFALLIIRGAAADLEHTRSVVRHKAMVYLGDLSFAFYNCHFVFVLIFAQHFQETSVFVRAGLDLVFATGAALLVHHFIERPVYARFSRAKRKAPPATPVTS